MAPSGVRVFGLLLVALGLVCGSGGVVLVRNGYEGVVVALEETLPPSACKDVVTGLEVSEGVGDLTDV